MTSQVEESLLDLECGGMTSEEGIKDSISISKRGERALVRDPRETLNFNGLISGNRDTDPSDGFSESRNVTGKIVELLIERSSDGEDCKEFVVVFDKRNSSDQCTKLSLKKASKPPRPPKGPFLSASDLKLVKKLSELAARKRARIERMKSSRKMKEVKRTCLSSNLTAMVVTIVFFLAVILQGMVVTAFSITINMLVFSIIFSFLYEVDAL